MKVLTMLVLALTLATMPVFAQRTPEAIQVDIAATAKTLTALAAELKAGLSETRVPEGGDLQAALNKGGVIRLTQGGTYTGSFALKSNTTLLTDGSKFTGSPTGPTLYVAPGTENVYVSGFTFQPTGPVWDQSVVLIGKNDTTQNTLALAPKHITIIGANIPSYRGKRGIEINGADVKVLQSVINDVYDPAGRDSQAIGILNAPCAPCVIDENDLSAGSENILVGGDVMKIVGPDGKLIVPTDLQITNNKIWKPLSWQSDGVSRGIKNLIELKTGMKVLIKGNGLDGSWRNAQDGYCMVLTPRSRGEIHDVLIEDNVCDHVGGGFNITGHDEALLTPAATSGVVIRRNKLTIDSKTYGGRGVLALITISPRDVSFDSMTVTLTGGCMLLIDNRGLFLHADGTKSAEASEAISFTNSRIVAGTYGIIVGGANTSLAVPPATVGQVNTLDVSGNTIADANGWTKKYFPSNTFVTRTELDALITPKS